jgi:hypothetical protein
LRRDWPCDENYEQARSNKDYEQFFHGSLFEPHCRSSPVGMLMRSLESPGSGLPEQQKDFLKTFQKHNPDSNKMPIRLQRILILGSKERIAPPRLCDPQENGLSAINLFPPRV